MHREKRIVKNGHSRIYKPWSKPMGIYGEMILQTSLKKTTNTDEEQMSTNRRLFNIRNRCSDAGTELTFE